ncbi:MAG: sodium:proton antiporter [Spirochaetales bacterium]|nr:sodium:proton antiporter [Candidatus Physcosoma equi]
MTTLPLFYESILLGCLGLFSILLFVMIYRSIKGPGTSNRIIAVNMLGTMVICSIAILAVYLDQDYLLDICLIYAMISFLSVVVIT